MSDSDDDSVEISDVDISDDESDAPSTVPSDDGHEPEEEEVEPSDDEEDGDELAPLEDDMMDREEEEYYDDDDDDEDYSDDDLEDGDTSALLAQHEDKFFERLNHFMDVQRKIEERMQKIDSKDRLKEIEVTTHSEGILEDDGTYKLK